MSNPMSVRVEVWPLAADEVGIWLISGEDAWRSGPVPSDSEPHEEVELLTYQYAPTTAFDLFHSTSWRTDSQSVILTYVALTSTTDTLARDLWPTALPITAELLEVVGQPPTHGATQAPAPRYIDVLMHGVRHLRFLEETDATAREAISPVWIRHLLPFQPSLAGMYEKRHKQR